MNQNIFFHVNYVEEKNGKVIPISVAFVAEDGSSIYCISHEFDHSLFGDKEQVWALNPNITWKSKEQISKDLSNWLEKKFEENSELFNFWGIDTSQGWLILKNHYNLGVYTGTIPDFPCEILQLAQEKNRETVDILSEVHSWYVKPKDALGIARSIRDVYFDLREEN